MAHKTSEILQGELDQARRLVDVGGLYYHYKNPDRHYVVEALVLIEETEIVAVYYRALYENGLPWIRPVTVFLESVETSNGTAPRFQRVKSTQTQ